MGVVSSVCCHDCGGSCPLDIHVKDGKITRIEPRDVGFPQIKACASMKLHGTTWRVAILFTVIVSGFMYGISKPLTGTPLYGGLLW